jgi:radical SAM protein with 4Fe4S-binding SPASM domain
MHCLTNFLFPFLDWIQVEVTSHCNARCIYCPVTVFQKFWKSEHISMETFEKLLPGFPRTRLVYLQGWGEPLTHPRFFEMVRIARKQGCRIGTTTNGILCDRETLSRMVREELSVVCFSLAGTGEFQNMIRQGTSLQDVVKAIHFLHEEKKHRGSSLPRIHVAYMWLRSHRDAIQDLPELLSDTGVSQVIVTTLDLVPHQDLAGEIIQAQCEEEEAFLCRLMAEVKEAGGRRGLEIHFRLVAPNSLPGICTENVTKSCFISSDGYVSPCVFKNLPIIEDQIPKGSGLNIPGSFRFGNINDKGLSDIWRQNTYKTFRRNHARGNIPDQCAGCPKLYCS